jgi:serine/tyrosine/threonine adenylyltransferase
MDNFDPSYTPNHDDHMLRYSYKNQPTIIWWNLVRLGEALGEMMGMGPDVDDPDFVASGVKEEQEKTIIARAEKLIMQAGEEYKTTFLGEYKRLMTARLGLRNFKESDFEELFSEALDTMENLELDFNHFFRRLSNIALEDIATPEATLEKASVFFHQEGPPKLVNGDEARQRIAAWLEKWRARIIEDWIDADLSVVEAESADAERMEQMKNVNPNFIPRGWILDEIIRRVEKEDDRDVLDRVMHMALNPFADAWDGQTFDGAQWKGDAEEEKRWTGDVPKFERAMQCSCSS